MVLYITQHFLNPYLYLPVPAATLLMMELIPLAVQSLKYLNQFLMYLDFRALCSHRLNNATFKASTAGIFAC